MSLKPLIAILTLFIKLTHASTWVIPAQGDLIGEVQYVNPQVGESLSDLAIRYDIGLSEITQANPHLAKLSSLPLRTRVLIPSQHILPPGGREGIVINLAEYRLYYYPATDNIVISMPVSIGRKGWSTPLGTTKIVSKMRDPIWRPTQNVIDYGNSKGMIMPEQFPSGEGNPLGRHAFRLGWPTYLIHGTNRPDNIGSQVSAGCIRMLPEDIELLFELVPIGTPVRVINAPVKYGKMNGQIYMEIHPSLNKKTSLLNLVNKSDRKNSKVIKELSYPSGIPLKIN